MQQVDEPRVSVIIPCYNHEQFIQQSIQSIIDQTYINIELIIIDDGSKDNSVMKIQEMIELCEERFTRFEFRSRANIGVSSTLNEGIEWCRGKYWTACSSDDFYHKDKVLSQVTYLSENKKCKFCVTESYVVNDLSKELIKETSTYNVNLRDNITFTDIFLFKVHLPVTGMYVKDFLQFDLGGFDSSLSAEDYDINLKIASRTNIGVIPERLYYYRSPTASGSDRVRLPMKVDVSESHLRTIKKYKGHPQYQEALTEWNFRRFIYYSSYSQTKIYAFKGMIKSYRKINNILYLKALFRLIFYWRKA